MNLDFITRSEWSRAYWAGRLAAQRGIDACPYKQTHPLAEPWRRGHARWREIAA